MIRITLAAPAAAEAANTEAVPPLPRLLLLPVITQQWIIRAAAELLQVQDHQVLIIANPNAKKAIEAVL